MSPIFVSLFNKLNGLFRILFGEFSWKAPRWLALIVLTLTWPLRFVFRKYWGLRQSAPATFKSVSLLLTVLLVVAAGGAAFYLTLPEPYKVTYTLSLPAPTNLEVTAERPVPIPNPLLVSFSGPTAPINLVGKAVQRGITVTPTVEGEWTWTDDSNLRFQPKSDWLVGQEYKVRLEKGSLKPGVLLSNNDFYFRSPQFVPSINKGEFYEDPIDPKTKQTVFEFKFTHPVNKGEFERNASLLMRVEPVKNFDDSAVKKLQFKVNYNALGTIAYLRSDSISIPEKDGEVLVRLDEGIHSANGGEPSEKQVQSTVKVPGIENYFKIKSASHNVVTNQKNYEAEKILTLVSTAGVTDSEIGQGVEVFQLPTDPKFYKNISAVADEVVGVEEESECGDEGCEGEGESESEEETYNAPSSCQLTSAGQVTEELLKNSKKVSLTKIPSEHESEKTHSFKYESPDGSCLFVKVKKGTKAVGDFALATNANFLVTSGAYPPDVQFMHKGAILSITGEKKLSVVSRNVKAIKFRLRRVLPNALNHLVSTSYGDFSSPNFDYSFGPDNFSESFDSVQSVALDRPGKPSYSVFDFSSYLASGMPRGLFLLEAKGWDEERKVTLTTFVQRLVLISDLGFIVKNNNAGDGDVYVASLRSEQPEAGAQVQVLGKNGLPIFEGVTDQAGKVSFPSFKDHQREKQPTVYVVSKGSDLSFMPYNRQDRELNFSRFDIGGLYSNSYTDSLQAYLFSDRGIYRPGEEARFGVIVKSNSWSPLTGGIPFQLTINDPRGVEIKKENIKLGASGFEEYRFNVSPSALTGYYSINLSFVKKPGDVRFLNSNSFKVEEFQPDRLKISNILSSSNPQGWVNPDGLKARVSLLNLFGTPAAGNTIKTWLVMSPASFYFPKFSDYFFYDPSKPKQSYSEDLGEVITDENGKAEVELNLSRFEQGTYRVSVAAEGFEKQGGRSVVAGLSEMVSPAQYVIGIKAGSDRSYIKKGTEYDIHFVAVSPTGENASADELELELVQKRNVSTLTRLESGSLAYQTIEKRESKSKEALKIEAGGKKFRVQTQEPGDFVYQIRNKAGVLLNSVDFSVVGDTNTQVAKESELELKLQRTDYAPGEEIEFEVRAPYSGIGLVTIEKDKVYAHRWFKTETSSSVQKITLPEGIEGNGYLNVSFVRSLSSPEIFVSPLSYGVKPFSVARSKRTEALTLTAPKQIIPGADLEISVSTAEPSRAVVFAVDEGILQVSKYKKPEPLDYFFQKRALEVTTRQIVDQLLPEFDIFRKLSGTGGDMDAMGGRYQNPFKRKGQKPVAYWSGIIATGPEAKKIKFSVPDYFNGNVKVFGLSVSNSKVGVVEKATLVQGDVVITPNAPVVAAPGDEFDVGAVISNLRGASDKVTVSLDSDNKRLKVSENNQELTIPIGSEGKINFKVTALDTLGEAKFKISATPAGSKPVSYSLDLSVRPASPEFSTIQVGSVKRANLGGVEKLVKLERETYPDRAVRELAVSSLPIGLVRGLQRYLEKYPYGCSEQITSQTIPTVALSDNQEFGISKEEGEKILQRTLQVLSSRQQENGSFSIWPGTKTENTWLNLHIARLLVEARAKGLRVEGVLFDQTMNYLRSVAGRNEVDLQAARERAYAAYLLTRENVITTSYLDTLKEGLEKSGSAEWKEDITALFMASTASLLKLDEEAKTLKKKVKVETEVLKRDVYFDALSHTGLALGLIAKHFPEDAKAISSDVFDNISKALEARRYSTISSSLLILALSEYQKALPIPASVELKVSRSEDLKAFEPLVLKPGLLSLLNLTEKDKVIKFEPSQKENMYYQLTETGYDRKLPKDLSNRLEVYREYLDEDNKPITSAKLGSNIKVRIVARIKEKNYDPGQVAIVDLYPSGFEYVSAQNESSSGGFYVDYADHREDRTILFGNLTTSALSYSYTLKATTKGKFVVPPLFAEAMYDQSANALSSSGTLTVE